MQRSFDVAEREIRVVDDGLTTPERESQRTFCILLFPTEGGKALEFSSRSSQETLISRSADGRSSLFHTNREKEKTKKNWEIEASCKEGT